MSNSNNNSLTESDKRTAKQKVKVDRRPFTRRNPDNGNSTDSTDGNDQRTSAKIISNISKKYMNKSESAVNDQSKSTRMDTDRSYDADIESCVSSQSDVEMQEEGVSPQVRSPQTRRKRMKKKGRTAGGCCVLNTSRTHTCENNNSESQKSSPTICGLRKDSMSPCVKLCRIDATNRQLTPVDSVVHNERLCDIHELSAGDNVSLRRLKSDLTDRYRVSADSLTVISGRQLRKRRVDNASNSLDVSSVNRSTGDSGVFVSPNAPSHKKIKTATGVSTSTPNMTQSERRQFQSDCFGFECESPMSPVEHPDTPMSDYPSSIATSEALTPMDMSYNIDRNYDVMNQDDGVKLFPTMNQQTKKKRRLVKKKTPDMTVLNAEFSEIENFQLTIE